MNKIMRFHSRGSSLVRSNKIAQERDPAVFIQADVIRPRLTDGNFSFMQKSEDGTQILLSGRVPGGTQTPRTGGWSARSNKSSKSSKRSLERATVAKMNDLKAKYGDNGA